MGVGAFKSSGFRVHAKYFRKLHSTFRKDFELFKVKTSLKTEGFLRATETSKCRNFDVSLKNRYFFTFASLRNVFEVVRPWELVRSKDLAFVYMLHTFKSFIRPLEKILELFKVKTSLKNESCLRATQTSRFRNFSKSLHFLVKFSL